MYETTISYALAVASGILLPVLLFAFFFILYQEYPSFTDRLALEKCEISLLLVGSVVGILLNIPLVVGGGVFLGINIGGAVIPLVLSLHLLWKHRPRAVGLVVSVALVSWASYSVTDFYPSLGIAASFPYYLFPPVLAFVLARLIEAKHLGKMLALAYSSGTLGALIGADLVRIPMILSSADGQLLAAIGGAGSMDMVFLSGLMAAALCILFFPGMVWKRVETERCISPSLYPHRILDDAWKAYRSGRYGLTVQLCRHALDSKIICIAKSYGLEGEPEDSLFRLRVPPHIIHDYRALRWCVGSERDALRSIATTTLLFKDMRDIEKERYKGLGGRILGFLFDILIVALITVLISLPIIRSIFSTAILGTDLDAMNLVVALVTIMGVFWAVEIGYFTFFEWKLGKTPGKKLMNMTVAYEDGKPCGFMPIFTRNVLRIVDELAILSIIFLPLYLILFGRSDKRQRIGDRLAGTVVLKG